MELEEPFKVERTIGGKLHVFEVKARNRPAAVYMVHSLTARVTLPLGRYEGETQDRQAYYREGFGIVGWAVYLTETVRI